MGPFQRGSIYDGTRFAGSRLAFTDQRSDENQIRPDVPLTAEAVFDERPQTAQRPGESAAAAAPSGAQQAGGEVTHAHIPTASPPSADAGAPGPATGGPTLASAAVPGAPPPGDSAPQAASPAAPQPAARILRLPPVEQAARPDLKAEGGPRQGRREPAIPRLLGAESDDAEDQSDGAPEGFRLFQPRTWFGGGDDERSADRVANGG
jgi:hypothetical protein